MRNHSTWDIILLHVLLGATSYGLDAARRSFVCVRLCVLFLCFNVDSYGMSTLCIFGGGVFLHRQSLHTNLHFTQRFNKMYLMDPFSKWYDLIQICKFCWCFSSSEPKSQVSFSDYNLSVVRRRRRCCCRRLCRRCGRKLFPFFFFLRPTGPISTKGLAQSILGWRRFKFVQMKGHVYFQ